MTGAVDFAREYPVHGSLTGIQAGGEGGVQIIFPIFENVIMITLTADYNHLLGREWPVVFGVEVDLFGFY